MSVRRLVATAAYLLVDLVRGQRILVPVLVFVLVAGVLLGGDHLAAPGPWPATTLVLYAVSAWVGLVAANAEDPVARSVTVVAAGGAGVVAAATCAVAMLVSGVLALVVVLLPGLVSPAGFPPGALLDGGLAHFSAAAAGCAVGLLTGRPLIRRPGWSFAVAALVVVVTAAQPRLPPVGWAIESLSGAAGAGTLPVTLLVALLALGLAGVANWAVARRG